MERQYIKRRNKSGSKNREPGTTYLCKHLEYLKTVHREKEIGNQELRTINVSKVQIGYKEPVSFPVPF